MRIITITRIITTATIITMVIAMDDFLWRAMAGTALLGAAAGPLGCFVLWRRMAYMGESIAHMGLLGAALGLVMGIQPLLGVALLAIAAALLLSRAKGTAIPAGTVIGIIGHAGLALGYVLLASMEDMRTDLIGYLFGDVLALSDNDVIAVAVISLVILALTASLWNRLLATTLSPDIARAEGRYSALAETGLLILIAVLVAIGLRVVGALLIVALIIIPPAAARPLARTPAAMAIIAAVLAALSAPAGLSAAYFADVPAGPAIVLAATLFFLLTGAWEMLRRRLQSTV
jgi:zinc transport system permease protein